MKQRYTTKNNVLDYQAGLLYFAVEACNQATFCKYTYLGEYLSEVLLRGKLIFLNALNSARVKRS